MQHQAPRLTDEACDTFRRRPGSFNDMVRAIYAAGFERGKTAAEVRPFAFERRHWDEYERQIHDAALAEAIEIVERLHEQAYSGGSEFGHLDGHAIIAEIEGKKMA